MKKIIIFHGQYGLDIFTYETDKQLHKIALHILKQRLKDFMGFSLECGRGDLRKEEATLDALRKDLDAISTKGGKLFIEEQIRNTENTIKRLEKDMRIMQMARTAVETENGKMAMEVLSERTHYEYEHYDLDEAKEASDLEE